MKKSKKRHLFLAVALVWTAGSLPASAQQEIEGYLSVAWGDPQAEGPTELDLTITDDLGEVFALAISDELLRTVGGPAHLFGQRARVVVAEPSPGAPESAGDPLPIAALELLPEPGAPQSADVSGPQPWISILCRFAGDASEPENLSFFQNMYGSSAGQLDHYWREQSYDTINVVGSLAVDWVSLPQARSFYIPGSSADLTALFNDCTAAANAAGVDFSNGGTGGYEGINMMFNDVLDCCAWGGGRWATLDGVTKLWRTTWEPPWGYADEGVIAHEMGHGFGLPHSTNWDDDGWPYDSPWDVMSAATGYAVSDPVYGRLGKHTIAYHKDDLGWFSAAERLEVTSEGIYAVTLDHLAAAATSNLRMIKIPLDGSRSYYVEARERVGDYDGNLPDSAVLIFETLPSRTEEAWLVDDDVPPAGYADNEGSMWKVGETFEDIANEIQISVVGAAPDGFDLVVSLGIPPVVTTAPADLDFGLLSVGERSSLNLQVVNNSPGPQTAILTDMGLSDAANFDLDVSGGVSPCGSTSPQIPSGGFCTVAIDFTPTVEATFSEELAISSNASVDPRLVPLSGSSVPCLFGDDVTLPDGTVHDTRTEGACVTLRANAYVVGGSADVTLRAGTRVVLGNGFTVESGGELTLELF